MPGAGSNRINEFGFYTNYYTLPKNSTLVEFKLASNTKLKQNLANQVDVYKAAAESDRAIKVILFFTDTECKKVYKILNELELAGNADIVMIDARNNKESASNVKF